MAKATENVRPSAWRWVRDTLVGSDAIDGVSQMIGRPRASVWAVVCCISCVP